MKDTRTIAERVLAKADRLDPNDQSTEARVIREAAASIRDHEASQKIRDKYGI